MTQDSFGFEGELEAFRISYPGADARINVYDFGRNLEVLVSMNGADAVVHVTDQDTNPDGTRGKRRRIGGAHVLAALDECVRILQEPAAGSIFPPVE